MDRIEIDKLKNYLRYALDVEMDIYTQERLIVEMKNSTRGLAVAKSFQAPVKEQPGGAGLGSLFWGIAGGLIGIFAGMLVFMETAPGLILGALGMTAGFMISRTILNKKEEKELDEKYKEEYERYYAVVTKDRERVAKERRAIGLVNDQVKEVEERLAVSREMRKELYDRNVIHQDYRNICAVAAIYSYLDKGLTYDLVLNTSTGDRGAYAIYEDDLRWGRAYAKLDTIISKLDQIIENQQILIDEVREANKQVKALQTEFHSFALKQLAHNERAEEQMSAIEQNSETSAYYSRQSYNYSIIKDWVNENY